MATLSTPSSAVQPATTAADLMELPCPTALLTENCFGERTSPPALTLMIPLLLRATELVLELGEWWIVVDLAPVKTWANGWRSDPIEAGAFTSILAANRTEANPIYIGSLKSNFG